MPTVRFLMDGQEVVEVRADHVRPDGEPESVTRLLTCFSI